MQLALVNLLSAHVLIDQIDGHVEGFGQQAEFAMHVDYPFDEERTWSVLYLGLHLLQVRVVDHALLLSSDHVLIDLMRKFWDILRITEVKFIWQGHTFHHFLLPNLHPLPEYILDGALLNKTAPFFGDFRLNWTLACRLSFPLVWRHGMPKGALIEEALILWLCHLAGFPAIIVIAGRAPHLILVFEIAKIMLILLGLFRICLHLAYILLWTNWLGA